MYTATGNEAPITSYHSNAFLNYLRDLKAKRPGWDERRLVRFGETEWKAMPPPIRRYFETEHDYKLPIVEPITGKLITWLKTQTPLNLNRRIMDKLQADVTPKGLW